MKKLVISLHRGFISIHYHHHNDAHCVEIRKGVKPMKINRFIALAVIALLVVGAMGAVSMKVMAKGSTAPATQTASQVQDCSQDQADGTELKSGGPDTDNVELQCGDQNASDTQPAAVIESSDNGGQATAGAAITQSATITETVDTGGQETVGAADTDNIQEQVEEQVGDQSGPDSGVEAPEAAEPGGK
jgi:hypothetical protein